MQISVKVVAFIAAVPNWTLLQSEMRLFDLGAVPSTRRL